MPLPLRHLHLDFHTSGDITPIAGRFDASAFQAALRAMRVASVNLFATCWHGWSYFPSTTNPVHPGLSFDLLGAQIAAARAVGVRTVIYLSTGPHELDARRLVHQLKRGRDGALQRTPGFDTAGFHVFCLSTSWQERVLATIAEVLQRYPCDGLWLDGASADPPCWCEACRAGMAAAGVAADDPSAVLAWSRGVFAAFATRVQTLVGGLRPGIGIIHNSGHVQPGQRALGRLQSHLELESLPTAGWGYDHFPISARHVRTWGLPFLGMTGRFHRGWGEFGGCKHPDALRWEAACCLAYGGGVSIGDQLPPEGRFDEASVALVGAACAAVAAVEPWCLGARAISEAAVLIAEAVEQRPPEPGQAQFSPATVGVLRLLEECQCQFDVIDAEADLGAYRLLVLPEGVPCDAALAGRIRAFAEAGGKILALGDGGLGADGGWPADLGAVWQGVAESEPSFVRPCFAVPDWQRTDLLCQGRAHALALAGGEVLAWRRSSLFPRRPERFCSHLHAPSAGVDAAPGMVAGPHGICLGWDLGGDFAANGHAASRLLLAQALQRLLAPHPLASAGLPPGALVTLTRQEAERRTLLHLVWAPRRRKGDIEVIDQAPELRDIAVELHLPAAPARALLVPDGTVLPLTPCAGGVRLVVPRLRIHALVCLDDA